MTWKPHVTVAAVVESDGKFLLVEERVAGRLRLNQPAGHLDSGESLPAAVVRETLEETGADFLPHGVVGVYLWRHPVQGHTIVRFAFRGELLGIDKDRPLDAGIERTLWMTRAELHAAGARLRSPLVMRCVDDYLAGRNTSLDLLAHVDTDRLPPEDPRKSG